jgi:hypothetical protein
MSTSNPQIIERYIAIDAHKHYLVVVWHVLTECVADRKADEDMVAFKLMLWSWGLGKEGRGGLTKPQFVRAGLMRLEMRPDSHHPWWHGAPDRLSGRGAGSTDRDRSLAISDHSGTTGNN